MRPLALAMLGAAALHARAAVLWETNIALTAADARESERVRAVATNGRLRVEHSGTHDWWSQPQPDFPAMPGAIAEVEAVVTFRPGPGGEAGVGFIRRDGKGTVVEWTHQYSALRAAATGAILRARARIPTDGGRLSARLIGRGPGSIVSGSLKLSVRPPPAPPAIRSASISNQWIAATLDPANAAVALRDLRTGKTWRQIAADGKWRATSITGNGRRLAWSVAEALEEIPSFHAVLELDEAAPEAVLTLSPSGTPATPLAIPLAYPYPWAPNRGAEIILPLNEGIGYPVDDPAVPTHRLIAYGGHGICMAFYGIADGDAAVMAIIETPDDAAVRTSRSDGLLTVGPEWDPQKGAWGYPRRLRWRLFDRGGYVALCRRYREHARRTGLLVTLREKAARNPDVARLAGAANVWFKDRFSKIDMGRELIAAGIDRVLWSAGGTSNEIAELTRLGFLVGRYDIYQDCMDPAQFPRFGHVQKDWTSEAWPTGIVRRADGDWVRGWQVRAKDTTMIPCGVLCDRLAPDWARRRIGAELAQHPYRARFIPYFAFEDTSGAFAR